MKVIRGIGMVLAMIGVCGIPGAIEFGSWIPTLLALAIGITIVAVIEKRYHIE